ncbi:YncE family protein [Sphingomonas gilva]|uniref:YncE family protein n=1 Tax=Sphingomonas gilva TaxID=2305907 RepID=A0A396RJI4_9SPHN|nr:YncE family protein [Sphingomonas gilva]RHW16314.1 YncE family protein [Sphingomonas gilva]
MRTLLAALALLSAAPTLAQTLIVGNKGEDTVSFIDLQTAKERARVATGDMPHEIAVSPDGKQAAVVAYGGTTIDVFDVASAKKLRTIDLAPNQRPHGLLWLADGRLVATAEASQSIAVVAPDGQVTGIRTDQQGSHMVAITPDAGHAFVANIGSGTVSVIDLAAGRKLRDIATGGKPEGIAVTPDGKQLWVGDLDAPRVQAFDASSYERLAEVAIPPVAIRVLASPDGKWIATSNIAAGSVSLIDPATLKVSRTIPVSGEQEAGQVTLLFSPDNKRLYAAETGRDQVAEIDLASGKVLRRIPVGKNGDGLAIAP